MIRADPLLVLAAIVALLPAGCPLGSSADDTGVSTARHPGGSYSGSGQDADAGSGGAADGAGPASGGTGTGGSAGPIDPGNPSAAERGSAGADTVRDGLSVSFPDCEEPVEADYWRGEVLRLVNQERLASGVRPLARSVALEEQATQYACELIHFEFFAHVNPVTRSSLAERADEFGYDYWVIGENLAAGQSSPAAAFADWMDSPCHRQNIRNPAFTELGVGIRFGGEYGYYWVQEFGRSLLEGRYSGPAYRDPDCHE